MGEHSRRAALLLRGQHQRPGVSARLLEAIERTAPPDLEREVLVLDNASDDGSAEAVKALNREITLIALDRRTGKAANDSRLLRMRTSQRGSPELHHRAAAPARY
jgi:GT2 family glycosyltransferase